MSSISGQSSCRCGRVVVGKLAEAVKCDCGSWNVVTRAIANGEHDPQSQQLQAIRRALLVDGYLTSDQKRGGGVFHRCKCPCGSATRLQHSLPTPCFECGNWIVLTERLNPRYAFARKIKQKQVIYIDHTDLCAMLAFSEVRKIRSRGAR